MEKEAKLRSQKLRAPLIWVLAGLLVAGWLVTLVYQAWPVLYPQEVARAPVNSGCDLRIAPCSVRFAQGGKVTLSIEPRDIPLVKPLQLTVSVEGLAPDGVEIDFAGLNMNMGYNRVPLEEDPRGYYRGTGMLPVCVRNRMDWEAKVMVQTPAGYLVAPFRFDTYRHGPPDASASGQ